MSIQDYEDEMDQYYNKWLTAKAKMDKQAARIAKLEAALQLAKDALADIGVDDVLIAIDAALER